MARGGKRIGSGRKAKLSPYEPAALDALKKGVERGDYKFVQLYFHYYLGKPMENKNINVNEDVPLFITD
jgi:hypothetical protein